MSLGIVVGHDGSDFADAALGWALGMAERLGVGVTVVRGWTYASAPRPASAAPGYVPPEEDFSVSVRDHLVADVAGLVAARPGVDVQYRVSRGPAANSLIEASADAELVVVGPRGLGGFRGLVMGSVSEQVVRHATCPVVVVRDQRDPADADRQLP